jgi:phosphoribosylaminoimidazole-succinocarboxamide synthase
MATFQSKKIYEGKAKQIWTTSNQNEVIIRYKDDATAGNGAKHASIAQKGILNNQMVSIIYAMLNKKRIATHFIKKLNDRDQLCKRVNIIPLEVIVRNVAAGSMAKRLGLKEGMKLKIPTIEFSYKDDALGDPLINDYHAVAIGAAT